MGGDLIILEEAAACEQKMVKEVVVPLLVVDTAVLICISTLKEADNSYSKMFEAIKPDGSKMFEQMQVCKQVVLLTLQLCSDLLFVCDRSTWFVMRARRVTSLRIARTSFPSTLRHPLVRALLVTLFLCLHRMPRWLSSAKMEASAL